MPDRKVVYGHYPPGSGRRFARDWSVRLVPQETGLFRRRQGWRVELWGRFVHWMHEENLGWRERKEDAQALGDSVLDEIEAPPGEWVAWDEGGDPQ